MNRTDAGREVASNVIWAAVFATIALLGAIDFALDLSDEGGAHAAIELGIMVMGLAAAGRFASHGRALAREARDLREQARELAEHLGQSRSEAEPWRRDAHDLIAGLGAAIDAQLDRWALTPAEKEVALLLLKGLSHKEIAQVRDVGETTVRQQARAIYKKAGLGGRNDLAAFFLEDLLAAPASSAPRAPTA